MRPSVWVSTAEVGSTRTRNSGSISSTRTRASRWRWPPEKLRPRSSTTVSRPCSSASRTSSALASSTACEDRAVVRGVVRRQLLSERAAEQPRVDLAHDDAPPHVVERHLAQRRRLRGTPPTTPARPAAVNRPSRSAMTCASSGVSVTSAVIRPGRASNPECGSTRVPARREAVHVGAADVGRRRLHLEHGDHLAGADEATCRRDDALGGGAQRHREEGGEPVERDHLLRAERAADDESRREQRHRGDQQGGEQHLARLEERLRRGDPVPREPNLVAPHAVAPEELLLAPEPAQDAQPCHGVGAERGQLADDLTLDGLAGVERPHHRDREHHQDRHARAGRSRRGRRTRRRGRSRCRAT